MNETTLWNVAESQQNINQPTNQTEQPAQQEQPKVEVQPTQHVEQNNLTWNSSWVVEPTQSVQPQQAEQSAPDQQTQDLMSSINEIINEKKTLEEIAKESDADKQEKENKQVLDNIIKETVKDIPTAPEAKEPEVVDQTVSSEEDAKELESMLDDIKDKKHAEDIAKKMFLAYQKERNLHELDNQQHKELELHLKRMISDQKKEAVTKENDPRVVKLDDEAYTQRALEQAYKKDKSAANKQNLNRFYIAKLAVNNPEISANRFLEIMDNASLKKNTMWEGTPASAPVVEVKQPTQIPRWLPASKRGII